MMNFKNVGLVLCIFGLTFSACVEEKEKTVPKQVGMRVEDLDVHSEKFSEPVEFGLKQFPDAQSQQEYIRNDFFKIDWQKIVEIKAPPSIGGTTVIYIDKNELKRQRQLDTDGIITIRYKYDSDPSFPPASNVFLRDINCKTGKRSGDYVGIALYDSGEVFGPHASTENDWIECHGYKFAYMAPEMAEIAGKLCDFACNAK